MLYARALQAEEAGRAREACEAIRDEGIRADCLVGVSVELGPSLGLDPEGGCPDVPAGAWRDECYFMAAEYWREEKRDPDRGARLCEQAGVFAEDCAQHLWQTSIRKATFNRGADAMVEELPTMKRAYCRWEARVGHFSDIEHRFWQRYYGSVFESERVLDLGICQALPTPEDVDHCRAAGANTMKVRIHMLTPRPDLRARFCEGEPTVAAVSTLPHSEAVPDPLLDRAIAEMHEAVCGEQELAVLPTDSTTASAPVPCPR